MSRRTEQLEQLLREELSRLIDREIEFPEGTLVTITHVSVSPDIHYASAYLSILGGRHEEVLEVLQKNIYALQQMVNKRIQRRPVPRIEFVIDVGEERREVLEKSIIELKKKGDF